MKRGLTVLLVILPALFTESSADAQFMGVVHHLATWTGIGVKPAGLEVDASGNLYVADISGNQVLKYDSSGTLLQTIAPTTGDGMFKSPVDVAISPVDGSIYVSAATLNDYVRKFASDGSYSNRWGYANISLGIATDAQGQVYVGDHIGNINRYDADGAPIDTFSIPGASNGIALNPSETIAYRFDVGHTLYAIDLTTGEIAALSGELIDPSSRGMVAVDSGTGNIFVAERAGKVVQEFNSDGILIHNWDTWAADDGEVSYSGSTATSSFGTIFGIAVDASHDRMYVSDQDGKIEVFELSFETLRPGDANCDGQVDAEDAAVLATNWQVAEGAKWRGGDFNADGKVNDVDAALMATNWTDGGGASASVPEPVMLVLIVGGLFSLRVRRRLPKRQN